MPRINLKTLQVDFPYEPYPCQLLYMTKLAESLRFSRNALLESPTGTGKTLCFLCVALEWQKNIQRLIHQARKDNNDNNTILPNTPATLSLRAIKLQLLGSMDAEVPTRVPKIVIASRTHSQLGQVLRELKKTAYRPKVANLGSRSHLCVNPRVLHRKKLTRADKNYNNDNGISDKPEVMDQRVPQGIVSAKCQMLLADHSCFYKLNLEKSTAAFKHSIAEKALDIEDLVAFGTQHHICPYYLQKESVVDADLIVAPYRYIIHKPSRVGFDIDLKNDILIIDEAHNIENVCMEATSFEMDHRLRGNIRNELEHCLTVLSTSIEKSDADVEFIERLLNAIRSLDQHIANLQLGSKAQSSASHNYNIPGADDGEDATIWVDKGETIVSWLHECGFLRFKNIASMKKTLENIVKNISLFQEYQNFRGITVSSAYTSELLDSLQLVFETQNIEAKEKEIQMNASLALQATTGGITTNTNTTAENATMDPAAVSKKRKLANPPPASVSKQDQDILNRLRDAKFRKEKPELFENPQGSSVAVATVTDTATSNDKHNKMKIASAYKLCVYQSSGDAQGTSSKVLSYWCMNAAIAMNDLLKTGLRSIILTSGTLCPLDSFERELQIEFPIRLEGLHVIKSSQLWSATLNNGPSGQVLNSSFKNRDNKKYIFDLGRAMLNFSKTIPQGVLVFFPSYAVMNSCLRQWREESSNVNGIPLSLYEQMNRVKKIIVEPRNSQDFAAAIETYKRNVTEGSGGLFFAVCRGKLSEGIDFPDALARAVILTGIPYPSRKDPHVLVKERYEVEMKRSGFDWYSLQAYRAINQAIGRVIRHVNDFGAVILCDERFSRACVRNNLSRWLRPYLLNFASFGEVQRGLILFLKQSMPRIEAEVQEALRAQKAEQEEKAKTIPEGWGSRPVEIKYDVVEKSVSAPESISSIMKRLQTKPVFRNKAMPLVQNGSPDNASLDQANAENGRIEMKSLKNETAETTNAEYNSKHEIPQERPVTLDECLTSTRMDPKQFVKTSLKYLGVTTVKTLKEHLRSVKSLNLDHLDMAKLEDYLRGIISLVKSNCEDQVSTLLLKEVKMFFPKPVKRIYEGILETHGISVPGPAPVHRATASAASVPIDHKPDAKDFMKDCKLTLGSDKFFELKMLLKDLKQSCVDGSAPNDMKPILREIIHLFSSRKRGRDDSWSDQEPCKLAEGLQIFLPAQYRPIYIRTFESLKNHFVD